MAPHQQYMQGEAEDPKQAVAELAKALHELRSTQAQLLQAQKLESIGQLAAGIAHEINTPIQYVSDNVGFIKRCFDLLTAYVDVAQPLIEDYRQLKPDSPLLAAADAAIRRARLDYLRKQMPAALEQAIEGLQRVIVIVAAMKQFSHPSTAEHTSVDLAELIHTTVTIARHEWKYVAEMDVQLDPDLPSVPCQRNEISQVLLNLIVNAAHAITELVGENAEQKGHISIRTARFGEFAEIRICDTGSGIPEAIRSRVFDPFFTTKAVGKGTGQGLAIAYSTVVEKHRGQIFFETTTGKGTCFVVRLPLQSATESAS
ncbi:Histidine kinase-, DNA gyrase B-, and HSP90-like ATPase [Solimonas aquatica]|uniref:histidine kinase n=1 Tax=Solimonas aquatica TaxID=489703 RepID=A0A1H9BRY0_9GAMM|nr:ATP-binding protein [Solimonas aquatica]SEP91577.1 Histidine kinase-, DNA gyrase B-, and HSP90-like ATPase [Solimonas aquatica]